MWDVFLVCIFSTKYVLTNGWLPIRSAPYAEWTLKPSCQVKVDTVFQNCCPPSHSHPPGTAVNQRWHDLPAQIWRLELRVLALLYGTTNARPTVYVYNWFWCIYKSFFFLDLTFFLYHFTVFLHGSLYCISLHILWACDPKLAGKISCFSK